MNDGKALHLVQAASQQDILDHLWQLGDIDEIRQIDSVQLFVERARSTPSNFGLTPDNAEIVSTICHDLDGIPLAIELASARVSVLNVQQIQERLDRRFDPLVSTARADERHRTLQAAIDWSCDLLSTSERRLLQRLALFTAGFTLSMAESACAWGEIQHAEVLDLLSSLVSKSLTVGSGSTSCITLNAQESREQLPLMIPPSFYNLRKGCT